MLYPAVNRLPDALAVLASEIAELRQDISVATLQSWWSSSWMFLFKWEEIKQNLNKVVEDHNEIPRSPLSVGCAISLRNHLDHVRLDLYECLEILSAKEDLTCCVFAECVLKCWAFQSISWHWDVCSLVPSVNESHCHCGAMAGSSGFWWKLSRSRYKIG
jgi:hypothetical protein